MSDTSLPSPCVLSWKDTLLRMDRDGDDPLVLRAKASSTARQRTIRWFLMLIPFYAVYIWIISAFFGVGPFYTKTVAYCNTWQEKEYEKNVKNNMKECWICWIGFNEMIWVIFLRLWHRQCVGLLHGDRGKCQRPLWLKRPKRGNRINNLHWNTEIPTRSNARQMGFQKCDTTACMKKNIGKHW